MPLAGNPIAVPQAINQHTAATRERERQRSIGIDQEDTNDVGRDVCEVEIPHAIRVSHTILGHSLANLVKGIEGCEALE